MTLRTDSVGFTYKREPCTITVTRNNGYCWGEVTVLRTDRVFTVHTKRDWYDYPDDDAQDAFIRALRRKHHVDGQELFALQSVEELLTEAVDELRAAWNGFKRDVLPAKLPARKAALFDRLDNAVINAEKAICC